VNDDISMNEGDVPRMIDHDVMNDNDIPVMTDENVSVQEDPGAVNWHQEADQAGGAGHGRASGKFTWLADHHATTNDLVGRIPLKGYSHNIEMGYINVLWEYISLLIC
jgi:hypothetical protein